jgi:hypothetical protein
MRRCACRSGHSSKATFHPRPNQSLQPTRLLARFSETELVRRVADQLAFGFMTRSHDTLLLVVSESFEIQGRGLVLLPPIPRERIQGVRLPNEVLLRLAGSPDSVVPAFFTVPFCSPWPVEPQFVCMLVGHSQGPVAAGTQVHLTGHHNQ